LAVRRARHPGLNVGQGRQFSLIYKMIPHIAGKAPGTPALPDLIGVMDMRADRPLARRGGQRRLGLRATQTYCQIDTKDERWLADFQIGLDMARRQLEIEADIASARHAARRSWNRAT
jgi:hypothetical protein